VSAVRRLWADHSLMLVLSFFFTVLTAYSLLMGYQEYQRAEQVTDGFWLWWTWEYSTSLVADVFGAMLLVFLTKRLHEKGSAESK